MRYTYIVECADKSLYTGVTTDLERRVFEHNEDVKWAKYTKAKRPVVLVWSKKCKTRSDACKKEWEIKQMSKEQKLYLAATSDIDK